VLKKKPAMGNAGRVAVVGLRGFPNVQGGVEKHCQELYPLLCDLGYAVTVVARSSYVPRHPYSYKGVAVQPLAAPRLKNLETLAHTALALLWLACRRKQFDILHIHAVGPALFSPLARRLGLRVVVTSHGPEYERRKWGAAARAVLRVGERAGCRHAHAVIAVSRPIQQALQQRYRIAAAYIPNGLPDIRQTASAKVLDTLGLKAGRYLLSVGRLVPEKGFEDLIDAYARLDADWKLVIVGAADHPDAYSRALHQKAAAAGVIMAGYRRGKDLAELYSHAGLFVLPSHHEGLPMVVLESLNCGAPILVSDIPPHRELAFVDEMFPVGNVPAMARRIRLHITAAMSAHEGKRHSERRARLQREFDWNRIAEETAVVYRQAMGAHSGNDGGLN
jgi:glycosyltransferase involved in cell wall biosynthesis